MVLMTVSMCPDSTCLAHFVHSSKWEAQIGPDDWHLQDHARSSRCPLETRSYDAESEEAQEHANSQLGAVCIKLRTSTTGDFLVISPISPVRAFRRITSGCPLYAHNPEARFPRSRLLDNVKVRDQVSHPLRRDSGRSSNRNRHLSPSVNTGRLVLTNPPSCLIISGSPTSWED